MARQPQKDYLTMILSSLSRQGTPLTIYEINEQLTTPLPIRTLQRYLQRLIVLGKITRIGQKKSSQYQLAAAPESVANEEAIVNQIQQYVQQPLSYRKPIGYQHQFLADYIPNQTFYLSLADRQMLYDQGQVPQSDHLAGTFARHILNHLLIDLSWNSSRLEGNTYSLLETEQLLIAGKTPEGKAAFETQMILNHKAAIEFLVHNAEEIGFNTYTILNLHALLADNLLNNQAACGQLRKIPVGIHKSAYYPLSIPQQIQEAFQRLLEKASNIIDPYEQAFFIMVQLPYLQPFEDVNKRVSRLAANIPFIKRNLCPLSFMNIEEHAYIDGLLGVYELNQIELFRKVFINAYQHSAFQYNTIRHTLGEPDPFRLRYRPLIQKTVHRIVHSSYDYQTAATYIQQIAESIPKEIQKLFINTIEIELQALHEGNIARYQIRPSEFVSWKQGWQIKQ